MLRTSDGFACRTGMKFPGGLQLQSTLQTQVQLKGMIVSNFGNPERSIPGGVNHEWAIAMPMRTNGNMACLMYGEGSMDATIEAVGLMSATMDGEGTLDADATMGYCMDATMDGVGVFDADIMALGHMGATMDAGASPSAFDIAQEVWQSQATGYNAPGTMGGKVNAAGAAGNPWEALVASNQSPGTFGELVARKMLTVAKFLGLK
jgi:hypothetical protein